MLRIVNAMIFEEIREAFKGKEQTRRGGLLSFSIFGEGCVKAG